jgi:hypothetical protein
MLDARLEAKATCQDYAASYGFRNVDHLLEHLIRDSEFRALVVIDSLPEKLEAVLAKSFNFGVEVLELSRFRNGSAEYTYQFEPFLADLRRDLAPTTNGSHAPPETSPSEIDTVVVPAQDDGFQQVFIGEDCWYAVRLHGSMRPQIKYVAAYRVAPERAITHLAPVKSIEPWKDSGKFMLNFSEPASPIGPVRMLEDGRVKTFRNLRYTSRARLVAAKSLDDLW